MPSFSTIESSDPDLEFEHLRFTTIRSSALKQRGDICFFVPPGCDACQDVPLLLLLHGVYGSHWHWSLKGGVHRTAFDLISSGSIQPMVIAMPSDGLWGDGTAYIRREAADYEQWIVRDVVDAARQAIPCVTESSPLSIAGLSMGGFGALRLGAKYASLFSAISIHSSITSLGQMRNFVSDFPVLSSSISAEDADPLFWIRNNREAIPPLRIDCGTEDPLLVPNRLLHAELKHEQIAHSYYEVPGGHNWHYWRTNIKDTLLFVNQCCK